MKKRFIVALNSETLEQGKEFVEYLRKNNLGWWHWISNTWLIVDSKGKLTAASFRDDLNEIFPNVRKIVLELRGADDTWSSFGPTTPNENMTSWIRKNWKGKNPSVT